MVLCGQQMRQAGRPAEPEFYEFYNLGLGDPYRRFRRARLRHGRAARCVLMSISRPRTRRKTKSERIRVALIGKPNVGKSCLLNRVPGEERVHRLQHRRHDARQPSTRRSDNAHGKFIFIDTAGIRKKSKVDEQIEKYSASCARMMAVERADVCVIMIDATEGVTEQDTKVAGDSTQRRQGVHHCGQ